MVVVSAIATILYVALFIYFLLMWARFIFDLLSNWSGSFRPKGPLLIVAEIAYTVTDPPIRAVRKVLPPLRIGGFALDFGWTIVMIAVIILMSIVSSF
jgi:YggT family protein